MAVHLTRPHPERLIARGQRSTRNGGGGVRVAGVNKKELLIIMVVGYRALRLVFIDSGVREIVHTRVQGIAVRALMTTPKRMGDLLAHDVTSFIDGVIPST
jgi:hypothetical protein